MFTHDIASILSAAQRGDAAAQCDLAFLYENGHGVEKDLKEAIRLYRLAAGQGNSEAQNSLGYMYQHGIGVEKDLKEAIRLYRLSADQGDSDGQNSLALLSLYLIQKMHL